MLDIDKVRTEGLRILARRSALTESDWFNLLEARRVLLEPYLREMTLKTLGDLKIVRNHQCERPLRKGGMEEKFTKKDLPLSWVESTPIVEGIFSLDTRGIFPNDEVYFGGHFHWDFIRAPKRIAAVGEVLKFWGLTRNNQWILVELPITYHMVTYHSMPGTLLKERTEQRSKVEKVVVCESTPQEICQFCKVTPQWIWQRLGDVVREWVKHRQNLLSNVEELANIVQHEETMLEIIKPK